MLRKGSARGSMESQDRAQAWDINEFNFPYSILNDQQCIKKYYVTLN